MYQSEADRENKARERLKRLVERGGTVPAWMRDEVERLHTEESRRENSAH